MILSKLGGVCFAPTCDRDSDCFDAQCGVCGLVVKPVSVNSGRDALEGIRCDHCNAQN